MRVLVSVRVKASPLFVVLPKPPAPLNIKKIIIFDPDTNVLKTTVMLHFHIYHISTFYSNSQSISRRAPFSVSPASYKGMACSLSAKPSTRQTPFANFKVFLPAGKL